LEHGRQIWYDYGERGRRENTVDITALAETLRSNWLIVALVLFAGVVFWGFWPRRKRRLEESSRPPPDI
jgi:cbb3-type cytochrome oxidase subunit 3